MNENTETKLGGGMYDKVRQYGETIDSHHERITFLEENGRQHEDRLKQLEDQSIKLENTIMTESRETRITVKEQTEKMEVQSSKLYDIVHTSINYKSDSQKLDYDLKKMRIEMWTNVFLKLSGGITLLFTAGGAGYWFLQQYFNIGGQ